MSAFQFKQFTVIDNDCTMRVGTDAVLLGSWTNIENAKTILDIGTGCGVISLMLAQRTDARITAIDIDEKSIETAHENFSNTPWSDKLEAKCVSLQDFTRENIKFDVIVSNPPFFVDSLNSPNHRKNIARHTNTLSFEELISCVSFLLTESGFFTVIIPIQYFERFNVIAMQHNLFNTNKTIVYPNDTKPPKRLLLKYSKELTPCIHDKLYIEKINRFEYTAKFIELTKEYYLFM